MSDITVTVVDDVVHVVSTGAQGPAGPAGTIALADLAAWDPAVHYLAGAPVLRNNRVYIATADNTGADPTGGVSWALVDVETTEGAQAKVSAEAGTARAAEAANAAAITTEAATARAAEAANATAITAEAASRAAADSANAAAITSEAATARAAEQANATAITAEAANRANADALLIPLTQKGAANGVATLGSDSKLSATQLPALAINDFLGNVASQAAMLALTGQRGDWCVRTDFNPQRAYRLIADDPTQLANWVQTGSDSLVNTVAGKTGDITLAKGDVGLANVDNTSDANKPVSTAQQAALDTKATKALNLSDLADSYAALSNLGLGSGATVLGRPRATSLWHDRWQRPDGPLVGDHADSGHLYVPGAGTNNPWIRNGVYAGDPADVAGTHISSFVTPGALEEIPGMIYAEVSFDTSLGSGGLQRVVFVWNPPAGSRIVAAVVTGATTTIVMADKHGLVDGQKVTFNASFTGVTGLNSQLALVTIVDDWIFTVPISTTGTYTGTNGKITTGLANQSWQAWMSPTDYGFFYYDVNQNYIAGSPYTFPTPLAQDRRRYQVAAFVDPVNQRAGLLLPEVGLVTITDSHVSPVYVGRQPNVQRDIGTTSGNVYVHAVDAFGAAHKPIVVQSQPRVPHFSGDTLAYLEAVPPGWWTPGDFDFIALVKLDSVTSPAVRTILSFPWGTGPGKRTGHVSIDTNGKIQLQVSIDGQNANPAATSTNPLGTGWTFIRVTRVASSAAIALYTSPASTTTQWKNNRRAVPWSANGTATGTAGAPFKPTGAEHFQFGNRDTSPATPFIGAVAYVALLDGIGGTPVIEIDFRSRPWEGVDAVGNRWSPSPLTTLTGGIDWLIPEAAVDGLASDLAARLQAVWATPIIPVFSGDSATALTMQSTPPALPAGVLAFMSLLIPTHWAGSAQAVISQYGNVGGRAFWFGLSSGGFIELGISLDGSAATAVDSSQVTGFTDGQIGAIAALYDPATGTVTFYTSTDLGVTWNLSGTTRTLSAGEPAAVSEPWRIANRVASSPLPMTGTVVVAKVLAGSLTGTLVGGIDFRQAFNGTDPAGLLWAPVGTGMTLSVLESTISGLTADLAAKAPLASPTFTGTPTAPRLAHGVNAFSQGAGAYNIDASLGDHQVVTLTTNAGAATITNPVLGQELTLEWKQDATGGRTYSLPVSILLLGQPWLPSTAAGARDVIVVRYNGSNWIEVGRGQNNLLLAGQYHSWTAVGSSTWTVPVTGLYRAEIAGGGGGGGGGGADALTTPNGAQVGGGGGGAGQVLAWEGVLAAGTVLTGTVGDGGAGGAGGTASTDTSGHAGSSGSGGGNSTLVGTGVSLTAHGGSITGGVAGAAKSSTAVAGGTYGGGGGLRSTTAVAAGQGGQASSTGGTGGVSGAGTMGGGGGGGSNATSTLGGNGGSAGGANGAFGAPGTGQVGAGAAGAAGADAVANSGAGAGGGGGGAPGGAGGTGGKGGSGWINVRLVG